MRKKFLVILSLFIAMILCFTAPAVALADSVVVNPGSGGNVTVIVPTDPGDGTSTIVTVTEDKPVIGDVVSFAEHEWYVIGTDSEGVIAPEGCYTLFAKNDEVGSTAFRSGMSNKDISIVYYKDSDLKKAMENIANGFSSADIANIVPRATLDGIWGDAVTDQLLWPIGWAEEGVNIATSIREVQGIGCDTQCRAQIDTLQKAQDLIDRIHREVGALEQIVADTYGSDDITSTANYYTTWVIPAMNSLREAVDSLESMVGYEYWPYPSYGALMFNVW